MTAQTSLFPWLPSQIDMPPKRKKGEVQEETRSPAEIAVAQMQETIRQCENQIQQFKEGVHDLAVHTVRMKQLEADIIPKESELKGINHHYHKLLENCTQLKIRSRPGEVLDALAAEAAAASPEKSVDEKPPSRAVSRAATGASPSPQPSSPAPGTAAGRRDTVVAADVADETPAAAETPSPENNDRDAIRHLMQVVKENIAAVVGPLYHYERTQHEIHLEQQKEREDREAAARLAADAAAATPGSPTVAEKERLKEPKEPKRRGQEKSQDVLALLKSSDPTIDPEIYTPPGFDVHMLQDLHRLRLQRMHVERQLKTLRDALSYSRQTVARRNNEGASKAALKKEEKRLTVLQGQLIELQRQKDEYDTRKRVETPPASTKRKK